MAITPDGLKAYVAHAGADSFPSLTCRRSWISSRHRHKGARQAHRQGQASYVHDDLRLTRMYVRTRIPVGTNPRGIAVSPDGKLLAVTNRLDDSYH